MDPLATMAFSFVTKSDERACFLLRAFIWEPMNPINFPLRPSGSTPMETLEDIVLVETEMERVGRLVKLWFVSKKKSMIYMTTSCQ